MHPWCTENWLGAGSSKFFACEQPERARSTDAVARKRKTHVLPNGSVNVSSRKRICHCNAFQWNNAVKIALHHLKTTLYHCNSVRCINGQAKAQWSVYAMIWYWSIYDSQTKQQGTNNIDWILLDLGEPHSKAERRREHKGSMPIF